MLQNQSNIFSLLFAAFFAVFSVNVCSDTGTSQKQVKRSQDFSNLSHRSNASMDQARLEDIVKQLAEHSSGTGGVVEFQYNKVKMYLISDVDHNRMRIIAPIVEYKKLTQPQIDAVMNANFHDALDARYAVSKDVLYSAFIHPLKELTENQVLGAVLQVSNLALSFGYGYTSGTLSYGKGSEGI